MDRISIGIYYNGKNITINSNAQIISIFLAGMEYPSLI